MQTHYSKKTVLCSILTVCGGYASRVNSCTSHSISTDNVEALILSSVKRFSRFVLNDEQAFALELQSLWNEKQGGKAEAEPIGIETLSENAMMSFLPLFVACTKILCRDLPERQYKQLMTV